MNRNFDTEDAKEVMKFETKAIPLFWMHEQTGMMKSIVMKYMNNEHLTNLELNYLKWYVIQWIDAMVSKPLNYKTEIEGMNQKQITEYIPTLLDYGIDPF